jgi:Uncharacterized protein conserved in bacteria (DUF2332)
VYHTSVLYQVPAKGRRRFAAAIRGLPAVWLSNEAADVIPDMPVPASQSTQVVNVLARDGRTPLAFTDSHGTWLQWFPAPAR